METMTAPASTATLKITVNKSAMESAKENLAETGYTLPAVVEMLIEKIARQGTIPFPVEPEYTDAERREFNLDENGHTKDKLVDTLREIDEGKQELIGPFDSPEDLFKRLGI